MERLDLPLLLKTRRSALGQSPEDVADSLGVHVETVRRWERGENVPTVQACRGVAAYIEVPLNELMAALHGGKGRASGEEAG